MSAGDHDQEAPPSKKGEEVAKSTSSSDRGNKVKDTVREHWSFGLRIIELVLAVLCVGLVVESLPYTNYNRVTVDSMAHAAIVYSTFSGYVLILGVLVLGRILGEQLGWRTSLAFSVVGGILFVAAGGVVLADWNKLMYAHNYARVHPNKLDMMCASGVFAILNAVILIGHAALTWTRERD